MGEQRMSSALRHLLPAGLLLALTLLAYHPLTWQLGSKTIGGRVDRYIFLWDLWWLRHALFQLQASPLHTDFLFFPEGCSLAFHTLSLASGLCGLLAGPSADLILTYNLLLLLSTFLGGFFTFLLLRTLTGFAPGALLGAVIFVFSPPLWTAIFHGQMNISSIQWVPLFLWLLVRFLRTPGPGRSLPAALCLAAIFYTGFQQFVFTVLLALMIVPAERRQWRDGEISRRAHVRGAAAGLALFLLLAAPMALEMNRSCEGALITPGPEQMHELSIRPGRLLCNQIRNRWWRHWDAGVLERIVPRHGPMFGYVPCLLLVAGWLVLLIRGRADFSVRYWSLMTAILAWLPLGTPPGLLLLQHLPGLCAIRDLYRYCIPLALALAMIGATPDDILGVIPRTGMIPMVVVPAWQIGLSGQDNLDALTVVGNLGQITDVYFSVTQGAVGLPGSAVNMKFPLNGADIYWSQLGGTNFMTWPAPQLGLLDHEELDAIDPEVPPTGPPIKPATIGASYICTPNMGTVPFVSAMSVSLTNFYPLQTRRVAAHIDVTLANGAFFPNWRAGFTNLTAGASFNTSWSQNFPAVASIIGSNTFQLIAEDVTPAPYNQCPYPPSGDMATSTCVVVANTP